MNIDALNLTLTHFKSIGINAFDQLNNTKTTTPPTDLIFAKSSDENKVLLIDSISKSGVVMSKFCLGELFPSVIDIRPYKKKLSTRQKQLTEKTNSELNSKYSTELTVVDPDILNVNSAFDKENIANFFTFCRVFGFYELTLRDVHLSTVDNKLMISVNSTHDYFTGFIEVLV